MTLSQSVCRASGKRDIISAIFSRHASNAVSPASSSCKASSARCTPASCSSSLSTFSCPVRICSLLAAMAVSSPMIRSTRVRPRSAPASSSLRICSCNIPIRPSNPASSSSTCRFFSESGTMSSSTLAMASSTRIPLEKRLMTSFFSLSDDERKSSYRYLERMKLLSSSSRVIPSLSRIYRL